MKFYFCKQIREPGNGPSKVFALIMKISVDLVPRRILYLKRRTLVVLNNWLEMNNVKVKVEKLY